MQLCFVSFNKFTLKTDLHMHVTQIVACVFLLLSVACLTNFLEDINLYFLFQAFAVFRMLFVFFSVIPRRLIYICRRFGTLYLFHLQRQLPLKMEQLVFRNVGIYKSEAGESPKRKQTTTHILTV